MINSIKHRGPDSIGLNIEESSKGFVHLAHARLAILDLRNISSQPFYSTCKNFILTYNGEIYNYNNIKKELISLGYKFRTNSDTEVLLYAFQEWGVKCVDKFIGMFAFTIFSKLEDKIYVFRDRAGIKPLYYYLKDNDFIFASELKAIYLHQKFKKDLNKKAFYYFMQFGYIPAPLSIFSNTFKLEAGHYLVYNIKDYSLQKFKYWDISDFHHKNKLLKKEEEVLEELESLLVDSFKLRTVSDVPLGVFLSGGYDSSLLSALLCKELGNLSTFTIGFREKNYNEAVFAKDIAKHLGTKHREYYFEERDCLYLFDDFFNIYDEPFADSSSLPTILLCKLAKEDVKVVLSADGGDEIFYGYSKYRALNKFGLLSNLEKFLAKSFINILNEDIVYTINSYLPNRYKNSNIKDKFDKFTRLFNSSSFKGSFIDISSYIYNKDLNSIINNYNFLDYKDSFFNENINSLDSLSAMSLLDYKTFLSDDVLTKIDRSSMSVGIEAREPLLDHRLSEYLAGIPSSLKYKKPKYLLKKILYKYIPKKLLDRPKRGFNVPISDWLKKDLKTLAKKYLDNLDDDLFNKDELNKLFKAHLDGKYVNVSKLWFVIVYEAWRERWL